MDGVGKSRPSFFIPGGSRAAGFVASSGQVSCRPAPTSRVGIRTSLDATGGDVRGCVPELCAVESPGILLGLDCQKRAAGGTSDFSRHLITAACRDYNTARGSANQRLFFAARVEHHPRLQLTARRIVDADGDQVARPVAHPHALTLSPERTGFTRDSHRRAVTRAPRLFSR